MPTQIDTAILQFLKTNGPQSESDIAEALSLPIARVHGHVAQLSSAGDIICCNLTQFRDGLKIEGISCRLSCYTPPAARGRKPGVKKNANLDNNQPY